MNKPASSRVRNSRTTPQRVVKTTQKKSVRRARSVTKTQETRESHLGVRLTTHSHALPPSPSKISISSSSFTQLFSKTASALLILFFVLVPVADVAASEESATDTEPVSAPAALEVPPEVPEVLEESAPSVPAEEVPLEVPLEVPEETDTTIGEDTEPDASGPIEATEVSVDSEAVPEDAVAVDATTTPVLPTDTSSDSNEDEVLFDDTATTTDEVFLPIEVGTTTSETPAPEVVPEVEPAPLPVDEVSATTTPVATSTPGEDIAVMTHSTDADRFSFGLSECIPVGNGAFHCVKRESDIAETEFHEIVSTDQDATGDLEIYYRDVEGRRAITDNEYDDNAPMYDAVGEHIVWQALIDDRYQVMSYNIQSGSIVKLTSGMENSMQPVSYDGAVVFQTWRGDDWDIVLIDADGEEAVLTDNDTHDIAPSINAEYITWQSDVAGEWVAQIYDRATKRIDTVRGMDAGKVENPRMVLVFDSKKENGDIETVGYDPVSGTILPLGATPAPLPERIPEPEQEREEKALIQPNVVPRVETKASTTPDGGPEPDTDDTSEPGAPLGDVATTTPGTAPDIIDTESSTVDTTTATSTTGYTLDLRVPAPAPAIPDLVIPSVETDTLEAHATTT